MEWLSERPIAHRGLHSEIVPENSAAAFEQAVAAGYPAELDVRLSADGVPVVFHDRRLDRLTDGTGLVADTPWPELSNRRLLGTQETIPRLETVLDLVDGAVPLLVELKNAGTPGALESTVASCLANYHGDVAVQSFNPLTVLWFRRHCPTRPRGQLAPLPVGGGRSGAVLERLASTLGTLPDFIGYNSELLSPPSTRRLSRRAVRTLAWTVTSEETLRTVDPYVDNVIFESLRP